jgi:ATP-dependent helicase HrpB
VEPEQIKRLLLTAYPDRVARLRDPDGTRYLLSSGRGAIQKAATGVRNAEFVIALHVNAGEQGECEIHQAVSISEELLRSELGKKIEEKKNISWDAKEGRVVAVKEEQIGAIKLSSKTFAPSPDDVVPLLLTAVRESSLRLLTLYEPLRRLLGRVLLLRSVFPGEFWPDFSDAGLLESLDKWLAPHILKLRTVSELEKLDISPLLTASFDYRSKQALDELAPTHLIVPSGSRVRIDYTAEQPVLPVKLQELFGLGETPAVAGGRVKLLLHLLSPAGRPIQVTQDLKGFWDGSYHQVKKELKGRYPKHPWPDDPWSALPTRSVKSRSIK